jgi:hypothetical protein
VIFIDGNGRVGVVLRNIQIDPLQIVLGHLGLAYSPRMRIGTQLGN